MPRNENSRLPDIVLGIALAMVAWGLFGRHWYMLDVRRVGLDGWDICTTRCVFQTWDKPSPPGGIAGLGVVTYITGALTFGFGAYGWVRLVLGDPDRLNIGLVGFLMVCTLAAAIGFVVQVETVLGFFGGFVGLIVGLVLLVRAH